jgi:hypothetical protein
MPKPKLPDEKRKDIMLRVRFDVSEMNVIIQKAKQKNCKTISQYIRQLIIQDVKFGNDETFGMPKLQRRR